MIEEYVELLILAYFRNHVDEYSLSELRHSIGISFAQLEDMLERMIVEKKLIYEESMLRISFAGRLWLMNSPMEEYYEAKEGELENSVLKEAWPLDKPFYVRNFSKKKWRNS